MVVPCGWLLLSPAFRTFAVIECPPKDSPLGWHSSGSLCDALQAAEPAQRALAKEFRMPIQVCLQPLHMLVYACVGKSCWWLAIMDNLSWLAFCQCVCGVGWSILLLSVHFLIDTFLVVVKVY